MTSRERAWPHGDGCPAYLGLPGGAHVGEVCRRPEVVAPLRRFCAMIDADETRRSGTSE